MDSEFATAVALHSKGNLAAAEALYRDILAVRPGHADARYNRGMLLQQLGRFEEALADYDQVIALSPKSADAFINRGIVLRHLGRTTDALADFEQAIALNGDYTEAHFNRGVALHDLGRPDAAIAAFDAAIALAPRHAEAFYNRGVALQDLGRFAEALPSYNRAIALKPDYVDAYNNRGVTLHALNRMNEALADFAKAIALNPAYAGAFNNRGLLLQDLKQLDAAIASYGEAIRRQPDYAEALYNRSCAKLLIGDMASGWIDFEYRWLCKGYALRPAVDAPHWSGESLNGKSILIYREQALGDVIQFARFLPVLAENGARVSFLAPPELARLIGRLPGDIRILSSLPEGEGFDFQCAIMSLPHVMRIGLANLPVRTPYLSADSERSALWRARLSKHGFRIGICWQGNPKGKIDIGRSYPLRELQPLSRLPNVQLISLQKQHGLEQLLSLPPGMTVETLGDDFDAGPDAFLDTIAVMDHLDLIVTSDTSMAHLAGAAGRPVWVALKYVPDYRWLLDRADSPWYPAMRLFRQPAPGAWGAVFHDMAQALQAMLVSSPSSRMD